MVNSGELKSTWYRARGFGPENQGVSGRRIGDSDLNTKQFDHAKGGGPGGA